MASAAHTCRLNYLLFLISLDQGVPIYYSGISLFKCKKFNTKSTNYVLYKFVTEQYSVNKSAKFT